MEPSVEGSVSSYPIVATSNRKTRIIIFVVLLLLIGVVYWYTRGNHSSILNIGRNVTIIKPTPTPTPVMPTPLGGFRLSAPQKAEVNKPFEVTLTANSAGKRVISFDALIQYDQTMATYTSGVSPKTQFSLFPYDESGLLTLTGVKKLSDTGSTVLNDEPIAKIVFTPKRKGALKLQVIKTYKRATSGMLTTEKEDILKDVNSVTVTVQ